MVGGEITNENGIPIVGGKMLSQSSYHPNDEVTRLFVRCQQDYQRAWNLQHRSFDEFDGMSLLQRAKKDQETFGAFVGAKWLPEHKRWRWQGRKNTARNKLIGILAHMLSGMLFPTVYASNESNEPDKMTARVMRIIIEDHLKKAGYEMKFLYMVLSALVNPAVIVEVEYVEAMQKIKQRLADGTIGIKEAVDTFLSGLGIQIVPVDQFLIADFYTPEVQKQPYLIRVSRIPWDTARKIWGEDPDFRYVEAGKTRIVMAGQESSTLFDIEWTEADRLSVQALTFYYRDEDLEVTFVGGVFMGEKTDIYNSNPFKHRRMSLIEDEWVSIPIYQFAKSGFEPIDPTGRFFYYKSGAFKEYWDDATQNKMHQLLVDGTYLDVIKPIFLSGVANADSVVIAPGATSAMPQGAQVTPYQLGPNLAAAMNAMNVQEQDMSESTQDKIMSGVTEPGITATASIQAQNQAKIFLGVFGMMVADLIKQIGELAMDCTIQHETTGAIDASIPEGIRMKQKILLAKGKEKGKDITNRVVFTDAFMGMPMSQDQIDTYEWKLWKDQGGPDSDQRIYHVNPFKFARMNYAFYVDAEQIINHAMGNDRNQKIVAFQMLTDPRVAPFTDQKNVIDDFVIDEFGDGDPDRYRAKGNVNDMMASVMGQNPQPQTQNTISTGGMVGAPQLSTRTTL